MAMYYRTPWKGNEPNDYSRVNPHNKRGRFSNARRPAGAAANATKPRSTDSAVRPTRPHSRGGYGDRRSSARPQQRSSRGRMSVFMDISRFVNKAAPIEDSVPFVPTQTFAEMGLNARVVRNLEEKGYSAATPIQDQAIPAVLSGKDIVGLAETGTGKTGAFLIPLIDRVTRDPKTRVLIMAPTRELAVQIADEFRGFARALSLHATLCVGGAGIVPQIQTLRHRPAFVIGTPGRLKDLMERGALHLEEFNTVVLDEADRMLDMGFIADMRFILSHMPKERITLFFSATLSRDIEALIGEFLNNPVRISVKTRDTAATIDQDVVRIAHGESKFERLVALLAEPGFTKVLVFGRTKYGVERLARDLSQRGIRAEAIHGNKTHGKRLQALQLFKQDHVQVLVATDVAARGLDISGVSHVINYDLPSTYEDYVHRIGRTGRAGKSGKALTFI